MKIKYLEIGDVVSFKLGKIIGSDEVLIGVVMDFCMGSVRIRIPYPDTDIGLTLDPLSQSEIDLKLVERVTP
jgi:hypothetical protein